MELYCVYLLQPCVFLYAYILHTVMIEKRNWKNDIFQKEKDIESLEVNVKRSSTQLSEISQRLELCLAERSELEKEVKDLGSQVC